MSETLPIIFKYQNENNGYLYLTKFLNKHYKIGFNDLKQLTLTTKENINTSQILNHDNIYFMDLKKIKLVDNENLFKFIDLILISNSKTNYKFIKHDFNILILFNLNYINENFISKLNNIVEKNQEFNNFIFFSSKEKINSNKFYKIHSLSNVINLNSNSEFTLKYNNVETQIFKLMNYDIVKTELLFNIALQEKIKLSTLIPEKLYSFIINNVLIYNILHNYLDKQEIYNITFNIISMFPLNSIILTCKNIITYSTINNLPNNYNLQNIETLNEIHMINIFDTNVSELIKLKKYITLIKKILNN